MCKKSDEFKELYSSCQSKIATLENTVEKLQCTISNKESLIELYKQDYKAACKMGEIEKERYKKWRDDYRLQFKRKANAAGILLLTFEVIQIISFFKWI